MIVPEKNNKIKSFKIPRLLFHSLSFIIVATTIVISILIYNYWQILQKLYENKHLLIENQHLKEQIQLNHLKLNTLTSDLERVHIFEKKLRIITGFQLQNEKKNSQNEASEETTTHPSQAHYLKSGNISKELSFNFDFTDIENKNNYIELRDLYHQKIGSSFGQISNYLFMREWSELTQRSLEFSKHFAKFDYQYTELNKQAKELEKNILMLDQYLLDKDSILKSTPTILPTKGWITDYFGPRIHPISGRLKVHEGMDIGARIGTPILASANGVIIFSGRKPGFGNAVLIDHGYGIETVYAHANSLNVKKGQMVLRGEKIASVGNTGTLTTAPHLHYEIRVNGVAVNPLYFILD